MSYRKSVLLGLVSAAFFLSAAVTTQPGAKSMALDSKTGKIFLPAAEYLERPAGEAKQPGRTIKPGSFVLLVAAR